MITATLAAMAMIVVATFVGAVVKGVTTIGLAMIAVPLIALLLDVQTAVLSIFLSRILSDIAMLLESRRGFAWGLALRLRSFIAAGAIGVAGGTYLLSTLSGPWLHVFLGVTILVFVLHQAYGRPVAFAVERQSAWASVFGLAAGTTQGLTGIGGPYSAIYLYSLRLEPRQFVFLSMVIYLILDLGQLAAIVYLGLYDATRLLYALVAIPPVMLGTWLGIRLRSRLPPEKFRVALLVLLAASGVTLMLRGTGLH
jgi:uncharacterized protein